MLTVRVTLVLLLICCNQILKVSALAQYNGHKTESAQQPRREVLGFGLSVVLGLVAAPPAAFSFENKISTKYDDRPKRRGSKVRCPSSI